MSVSTVPFSSTLFPLFLVLLSLATDIVIVCDWRYCLRNITAQVALTTEQTKEALRLQFAEKAAAFKALGDDRSARVAGLDGPLEEQIALVEALLAENDGFIALLDEAQVRCPECMCDSPLSGAHLSSRYESPCFLHSCK